MAYDPGPTIPQAGTQTYSDITEKSWFDKEIEALKQELFYKDCIIEAQNKIIDELRKQPIEFKPGCAGYNFPYSLKYPLIP